MKKLLATFMLLMFVSVAFAGPAGGDSAIENPKTRAIQCHDKNGNWSPQDKNCDPTSCGCLFHQIEEFIVGLFE
jgi:hypothetical protein